MAAAAGTAAATSVADLLTDLLAPIREFFEGAALLVRRTFFNQAPTVDPVQLTGQSEGPITGVINAVDPEGDPLVYSISQAPRYGSAVVNADGSYTYPGPGFTGIDSFIVEAADTGLHQPTRPVPRRRHLGKRGCLPGRFRPQGAVRIRLPLRRAVLVLGGPRHLGVGRDRPVVRAGRRCSGNGDFDVTGESSSMSATLASAGSDLIGSRSRIPADRRTEQDSDRPGRERTGR